MQIKQILHTMAETDIPDPIINLFFKYKTRQEHCNSKGLEAPVSAIIGMVYGSNGELVTFKSVLQALKIVSNRKTEFNYEPVLGTTVFGNAFTELMFGKTNVNKENLAFGQTPGGSGALFIAMRTAQKLGVNNIMFSDPTWNNHYEIAHEIGLSYGFYRYLGNNSQIDFDGMVQDFSTAEANTAVLIQPFALNPAGIDLTIEELTIISRICKERNLLPILDVAYYGYGNIPESDILNIFIDMEMFFMVCCSASKAFTFYSGRCGAFYLHTPDALAARGANKLIGRVLRTSISTSASLPAEVITEVLSNTELKTLWISELEEQKVRILEMRNLLFNTLMEIGVTEVSDIDFTCVTKQVGLFSFLPLNPTQVKEMREMHDVWIVPFSEQYARICIAALNERTVKRLAEAIKSVLISVK